VWSILSAMVAWHRALACQTRHSKTLIYPSCKGTESFWILGFLADQARLSVCWSHDTWPDTWTCEAMRCWGFKRWTSNASLPVCFRLSVWAVKCCSHLARPCEAFHNWGGKICGTLIDQSHDAWSESGDMTRVMTSIGVGKCGRSQDIRSKSYILTRVGHTTGVTRYLHYKHV
jgi:hypothetical protein